MAEHTELNRGGVVPGELPSKIVGKYTYYGNPTFVDRVIKEYITYEMANPSSAKSGMFGKVYKVSNSLLGSNIQLDNKQYYVKKIIPHSTARLENELHEITMANELTAKVPDSVSNFKGARLPTSPSAKDISVYILFEGSEGTTLHDAFQRVKQSGLAEGERLKEYATLLCSAKRAIDSVNELEYHHNDAHSRNIVVIGSGLSAKCKLIDFGSTRKTGEPNILGYSSSTPSISKSNTYNKSNSLFSKDIDNLLYSFKTMSFSETPEFIQRVKRLILNRGNVAGKTSDDLLAEFFFSLCKNLIRLRDIPGQKSRLVQQALALKNQDKLKRLKEINDQIKGLENEEEELNEPFHTVTLPQSTYSQMFNANNTRLPEPVFMPRPPLNNGNSPPTVGERPPGSYGGRKKRKTRKRRTRRV